MSDILMPRENFHEEKWNNCVLTGSWCAMYRDVYFLTFSNKVEKCLYSQFVCLSALVSVCARSKSVCGRVNVLQMSFNLYMLFISDIAWTVQKMVDMRVMIRLQRHAKVFQYIMAYDGEKCLKLILTHLDCTKCNEINIGHSDLQKHVSDTVSHKGFLIYYGFFLKTVENIFSTCFMVCFCCTKF